MFPYDTALSFFLTHSCVNPARLLFYSSCLIEGSFVRPIKPDGLLGLPRLPSFPLFAVCLRRPA